MNPVTLRDDFPILKQEVHGKPLVYLDNAATSQTPQIVIDTMRKYYENDNANVHRAIHSLGERATIAYEATRDAVARFIGAPSSNNVVFTKSATEALNMVAYAWGLTHVQAGDEIVISPMEHHSNLIPWQQLALRQGATLRFFEMTTDGQLDISKLDELVHSKTKLIAITHMSNVLGTVNPIQKIIQRARNVGAVTVVDAAQSAPHIPIDVQALDCDFLALSAHKMCGPTGVGVLYGKQEALEQMDPFLFGGEMIDSVSLHEANWKEPPYRFEAGTPNIAGVIGFGAAIEYLTSIGMDNIWQHEIALGRYCIDEMRKALPDIEIYGPEANRGGLVCFNLPDVHAHDLAQILDQEGVAIRAGHHCAQPLMRWLGVPATARASFYLYNTEEEAHVLINALRKAKEFFA